MIASITVLFLVTFSTSVLAYQTVSAVQEWLNPSDPGVVFYTQADTITALQPIGSGDFALPVVDAKGQTNQTLTLSGLRGRVIVLEFMEPWCPHSQKMEPIMEILYKEYVDKGVVFVSVAGPYRNVTATNVSYFITRYNSTLTYVYDSSGKIFDMYQVTSIPTFFILSKSGEITATYVGDSTPQATLANAISQQLS